MEGKPLGEHFPAVDESLRGVRQACAEAGPLDAKTQLLIRLAAAAALGFQPAVAAEATRAAGVGATPAELRQAVLLILPNAGYVRTAMALTWINEVLGGPPVA